MIGNIENEQLGESNAEDLPCFVVELTFAQLGDPVVEQAPVTQHGGDEGLQEGPVLAAEAIFCCVALDE